MSNLTKTDLTERLKSAACCSTDLANKARKEKIYGLKCYKDTLRELKLLNTYIEILCEYENLDSTLILVSVFSITGGPFTGTITLTLEGEAVFTKTYTASTTADSLGQELANWINNIHTTPEYTATWVSPNLSIYRVQTDTTTIYDIGISAVFVTGSLTLGQTQTVPFPETEVELTDGDQCITEAEAQTLFEKITTICNTCYKTIGATYP